MKDVKAELEKVEKIRKISKRIFFVSIGIIVFCLVVDAATKNKKPKETQEIQTMENAAEVPVLKIPEVFYNGFPLDEYDNKKSLE